MLKWQNQKNRQAELFMKIQVYAILKDYFERDFILDEPLSDIQGLNDWLLKKNPTAADILSSCRFAVADLFVDQQFQLNPHDSIHIIPPSSGG